MTIFSLRVVFKPRCRGSPAARGPPRLQRAYDDRCSPSIRMPAPAGTAVPAPKGAVSVRTGQQV